MAAGGIFNTVFGGVTSLVGSIFSYKRDTTIAKENTWIARIKSRSDNVSSMTNGVVFIGIATVLVMVVLIVLIAKSE